MAGTATMATERTLPTGADVVARARTWWGDAEVVASCQLDFQARESRFRRDVAENWIAVYHSIRKRAAVGGDGTVSIRQIMRDVYADFDESLEFYRRRRKSVQNWLRGLERQGLIRCGELRGAHGSGKFLGLRVELLEVPEEIEKVVRDMAGCRSSQLSYIRATRRSF